MTTQERQIAEYASAYLAGRASDRLLVSTRETIGAIRNAFPDCQISDRVLADRIAKTALELGCPVSFDAGSEESPNLASLSMAAELTPGGCSSGG